MPVSTAEYDLLSDVDKVFADPASSKWLKNALAQALNRRPDDAIADARTLLRILTLRAAGNASRRPS